MKLEEQFKNATTQWFDVTECIEIAENFAIGFNEWCDTKMYTGYTTQQLLEIYKKQL